MDGVLPLVVAAIAAGAILLIFVGLASGPSVDPVQARLSQLGTMQAKNLEELELQAPLADRTLRPLMNRFSGRMSGMASTSFTQQTEKRLALAGNPGELRVADWMGIKTIGAVVGGVVFVLLFVVPGPVKILPFPANLAGILVGAYMGYALPEFWLDIPLREWLEQQLPQGRKVLRGDPKDCNRHRGEALISSAPAGRLPGLRRRRHMRLDVAWQCPVENRVYHVVLEQVTGGEELALPADAEVRCCRPVPPAGRRDEAGA